MRTDDKRQYQVFQYVLEKKTGGKWEEGNEQKTWENNGVACRRLGWTVQGEYIRAPTWPSIFSSLRHSKESTRKGNGNCNYQPYSRYTPT
jgi:hypothetical protein